MFNDSIEHPWFWYLEHTDFLPLLSIQLKCCQQANLVMVGAPTGDVSWSKVKKAFLLKGTPAKMGNKNFGL